MSSCNHLATKAELDTKADKKVEVEVAQALGIGLLAKELAGDNLGWINGKGANSLSNIASLKARTAALDSKAAKAGLDAALAGRQANKALSVGNSALGKAGAALGGLANVVGLIGTMATAAALAQLTKRVIENRKDFISFRVKTNKIISELNFKASSALNIANNNTLELEKQAIQIGENRSKANQALHIAKTNQDLLKRIEKDQVVYLQRLADIRSEVSKAVQNNNSNIANNPVVNDIIQQNRDIANRVNDLASLRNDVARVESLYRNAPSQVAPSVNPQTGANTQAISRLLTGVELLKARQNVVENKIQAITSQQDQLQNPPTFQSIDTAIRDRVNKDLPGLVDSKLPGLLDAKLPQLNPETNKVNEQKLDNIQKTLLAALPAIALIPLIYNKVKNQQPSKCFAPVLVPPVDKKVSTNIGLTAKLQAITVSQSLLIQKSVNSMRGVVNIIKTTTTSIQQFQQKAWEFTKMDKILPMLNLTVSLHNAAMLSNNVGETIGQVVDNALSTVGIKIKDAQGNPIGINEVIGNSVQGLIQSIIGTENYQNLLVAQAKANRIYQTGINLLSSVTQMLGSMEEIAEETGIDVAKIGNALRDSGTVEPDSYEHMAENKKGLVKAFSALEAVQEKADTIQSITSEVRDLAETASEFKEGLTEIRDTFAQEKKDIERIEEVADRRIENLSEPTEADKLESDND